MKRARRQAQQAVEKKQWEQHGLLKQIAQLQAAQAAEPSVQPPAPVHPHQIADQLGA